MLESLLSGKRRSSGPPGVITGVYEAQPVIASGDFNYSNTVGATLQVGDYLYIAPGFQSSGDSYYLTGSFYRIDLRTFAIQELASQCKKVSFASMCHDNGKIYSFGGIPGPKVTVANLCIYDIATNSWTNTGKFSDLRKNARTFVYNNRLYAVGGVSSYGGSYDDVTSCSLDDYSVINHGYFLNAPGAGYLQSEGHGVLIGSKFYFSRGGGAPGNAWMVFNAATLTLTILTPNPNSMTGESPVLFGDKIAVRNGNTTISLYDVPTDTWTVVQAQANASNAGNSQSANFAYDGSIWTKYLESNNTTARRFWRIN